MSASARLTSPDAWSPLPAADWSVVHARHLLRRAGWSAQPEEITQATEEGLEATLNRLFPSRPSAWPTPAPVQELWREAQTTLENVASLPRAERQKIRNDFRQRSRAATQDMALEWLQRARDPAQAAFQHLDILRSNALGSAPELTKAVSRSPAMIMYLDLQGSRRQAPNENFARELFELFVLGEGHYTEADIKEAARAFTGYRQNRGEFVFAQRQADSGRKSVFGRAGRFDGDDIIDLAYRQPAAATFLPGEMVRFYLTADGLPVADLAPLGEYWREEKFNLRALLRRFFSSRAFYDPAFRGNYIKSPVQFSLGLCQDLDLDVLPGRRPPMDQLHHAHGSSQRGADRGAGGPGAVDECGRKTRPRTRHRGRTGSVLSDR